LGPNGEIWRSRDGLGVLAALSALHLALQLVDEAPVRVVGDDLVRRTLAHPDFLHPQGVEADRVLDVEVAPPVVAYIGQGLEDEVVVLVKTSIDQLSGSPFRL